MDLQPLFKAQAELDKLIIKEKGLEGKDLLDKKILALQVELGELANEWQLFKFWKDNPEPRTFKREKCPDCFEKGYYRGNPPSDEKRGVHGLGNHWYFCERCAGFLVIDRNPLLEEYVDCLHFILGIGNDFNLDIKNTNPLYELDDITHLFSELISTAGAFNSGSRFIKENYKLWIGHFVSLGKKLGFTREQVEQAYYQKNEINHERQANGY